MPEHSTSHIAIRLDVRPVLSYPMANTGLPVIDRITITGAREELRGARLTVEVADAQGALARPEELRVDLMPGRPTVLTNIRLSLAPAVMLEVEEQRPGVVCAHLEFEGVTLAERESPVRVLAAHQWLARPLGLAMELLPAHVMPNHPSVGAFMRDVSSRLRAVTGSSSLEGYQSGPARVEEIVQAVYAEFQARGIAYAEPPASWADDGQKIRNPGDVLDGRVGTCLDTVVTMAAVLEQAGIRPLLWLVHGHAFLGYWREEMSVGGIVEDDLTVLLNRIDLGQIGLLETTAVTQNRDSIPFVEAQRMPLARHLTGERGRFMAMVDVYLARKGGIVALPTRTRDDQGDVLITNYQAPALATGPEPQAAPAGRVPTERTAVPGRVQRWKNALLDLSLRNRLINFSSRGALSLSVPENRLGSLEDLLHQGQGILLHPSDKVAQIDRERGVRTAAGLPPERLADLLDTKRAVHVDVTEAAYTRRLRNLANKARTIIEETGANNLYLCLGSLVWDVDGRALRSPLILVPVTLKSASRGGSYRVELDDTGTSTPNYCLREKLRHTHEFDLPGLTEPPLDGAGIDLDATITEARAGIASAGLRFRIEPTADLAILQFAKFRLWKDLDENWSTFEHNALVKHLIRTPQEAFADPVEPSLLPDLDSLDERCPMPADSSQLQAIADAVAGSTFVLEGPPGTGKSQTITNLLAHAVAEGRRVLFVAEKRAALDVVQRRLDQVGMASLALDLHDKGSSPNVVRQQIAEALDLAVPADIQDHSIKIEELRSARRILARYAHSIADTGNAARLSLYAARGRELTHADDLAPMPVPETVLAAADSAGLDRLRTLLHTLPDLADVARPGPNHPWRFIDRPTDVDRQRVQLAARRIDAVIGSLPARLRPALDAAREPVELRRLAGVVGSGLPLRVLDEVRTRRWGEEVRRRQTMAAQFAEAAHPALDWVTPGALDLPIGEIDEAARRAAASGWFGRRKRLAEVCERLAPASRERVSIPRKRLTEVTGALVRLRDDVARLADHLQAVPGIRLPADWQPFVESHRETLERLITWLGELSGEVDPANPDEARARFAQPLREAVLAGGRHDLSPVRELADALEELADACALPPGTLGRWAGEIGLVRRWIASSRERATADPRLRSLGHWLELLSHLEPLRTEGMDQARQLLLDGSLDPNDAARAFDLGLAQAAVAERLDHTGLDRFDPEAHERSIQRFTGASRAVRAHLTSILPSQIIAARGFDPAAPAGEIGALRRQLNVKRGGMKVRELMLRHGDLISRIMPCVLVSPDSLARFLPARAGLFDLVIFDEASQIRVADAVGAMGRARSVVVVGDSKQMPPTSVAETAALNTEEDSDDPEDVVEDEESILTECVQARVRSQALSWHYRSQDEALIAFSNQHYYQRGLSSFPSPVREHSAVSLVRVDGSFDRSGRGPNRGTNQVEAREVVREIERRFAVDPDREAPSLGVVTFNLQQRACIEGLLRDLDDPRLTAALEDPNGLFVKNLENVQGDERDVVLFSTGFSRDDRGRLPLNFGPLVRAGGERRLNVAVTRARREVMVFSSFDPTDLRVEDTSSVGIRHLRTYLEMAAHGAEALPQDKARRTVPDRHREQIAHRLAAHGLDVRTDVGLSGFKLDLVLAEASAPDRPLVAVLLDGPEWSGRPTARDRDALPIEVLSGTLGWRRVERVWLPDWLARPEGVVERLVGAVREARDVEPEKPVVRAPVASVPRAVSAVAVSRPMPPAPPPRARLKSAEIYSPWVIRSFGPVDVLDALPEHAASARVGHALLEVIAAEAPIHTDRLAELVGNGFGLRRVARVRRQAILGHLPAGVVRDGLEREVVWPAGSDPDVWLAFRSPSEGVEREVESIPLRELGNAMVALVCSAAGFDRGELYSETLRLFGRVRRTQTVTARLDRALKGTQGLGRLTVNESGLVTTGDQSVSAVRIASATDRSRQ